MGSSRRDFMKAAGAACTTTWLTHSAYALGAAPSSGRRNVLFIVVEDLKAVMGCYGNPLVKTPNLERLARQGVVFDRAYCQFPVCNPSRTSFLTGLRPDRTGIFDNVASRDSTIPNRITLPAFFKQNGYRTIGLGKIFHGRDQHDDPNAWDVNADFKPTPTGRRGEGRNMTDGAVKWCSWLAAEGTDEDQPDGQLAARAVELLRQPRTTPFFMAVGFHKPHDPFHAPKKYFDMYPLEHLMPPVVPENRTPEEPYVIGSSWKKAFDKFSLHDEREFLRAYYACTTFTDAQIGRVLDEMDRQDLWKNTVVVFIGDHGYELGEHDWWNKNVLFEDSARVPMIAVVNGETPPGRRCAGFVELIDLFPTFADLCGLTAPKDLDGISIRPLLSRPDRPGKPTAFTQVIRGDRIGKSVRTARWRYTEWRQDTKRIGSELYDHASDPGEYRNLASRPEFQEIAREHSLLLNKMDGPAA